MHIDKDIKLDFNDVLIVPQRSSLESRSQVKLERTYSFPYANRSWNGIGIIAANMDSVGTFEMAEALQKHKILTAIHKHYSVASLSKFFLNSEIHLNEQNAFYTVGSSESDYEKLLEVRKEVQRGYDDYRKENYPHLSNREVIFPFFLCIDVANGYTQKFVDCVKQYRNEFPKTVIMAGNVVTPNMAEELTLSGADIIKVGIGGGSVCTTRLQTGIGFPQVSAISDCDLAVHKSKALICSDGGCTNSGDVAKAFAAGADFVMIGGMLAGTDECNGEWIEKHEIISNENCHKITGKIVRDKLRFYGMSSKDAQEKYNGGVAEYKTAEGKAVYVPYKGPVDNVIKNILGGIRSTCTYVGTSELENLSKCASFIRVNNTHNKVFE